MKTIFAVICVFTVLLAGCSSQPHRFSSLHSGELIASVPQPELLVARGTAGENAAITTGVLLGGIIGGAIAEALVAGNQPGKSLVADNLPLNPYLQEIDELPVRSKVLSLYRTTKREVSWLHTSSPIRWQTGKENLQKVAEASDADGVVSLTATVYLSADLRQLLAVVSVKVFEQRAGGSPATAHRRFLRAESLDYAKVQGGDLRIKADCLDRQHPRAAKQACARLWAAHSAYLLRSALKSDIEYLQRDVVNYLNGRKVARAVN